ncbi:hypothetical protein NC99_42890 [Sunxiuqinia dokdonensis]|uniref:Uncharacterized protein n=1 Tax=Sunxiuqinia dokdonensis TaxID=1409788 RepID=A0A0L8V335_9BACT|nr:hypothetical protein NC99_42890 [Sunxiuqinia dokdonensis]
MSFKFIEKILIFLKMRGVAGLPHWKSPSFFLISYHHFEFILI